MAIRVFSAKLRETGTLRETRYKALQHGYARMRFVRSGTMPFCTTVLVALQTKT